MKDQILAAVMAELLPTVLEIAGVGLAAVLSWVALTAKKRLGLDIEKRHQDALHSAIMSGVRAALQRGLVDQNAVLAEAVRYAKASVPDAIKGLAPQASVLQELARAKFDEIAREQVVPTAEIVEKAAKEWRRRNG